MVDGASILPSMNYPPTGSEYGGIYSGDISGIYPFRQRHGRGVMSWSNNDKYDGEWLHDEMSGRGIITYSDGNCYEGQFFRNDFHGCGVYRFADGRIFHGKWKAGNPLAGAALDGEGVVWSVSWDGKEDIHRIWKSKMLSLGKQTGVLVSRGRPPVEAPMTLKWEGVWEWTTDNGKVQAKGHLRGLIPVAWNETDASGESSLTTYDGVKTLDEVLGEKSVAVRSFSGTIIRTA